MLNVIRLDKPFGSDYDQHLLLSEILDQINVYDTRPKEEPGKAFDVRRDDVRFTLEPVFQHPLDGWLAFEALNQLYELVFENQARELVALVECDAVAYGRVSVRLVGGAPGVVERD